MPERWRALAPGKINLCLYLGPVRGDGRHELVTVFESLSLADVLSATVAETDVIICPGVSGENLAARALAALRAGGWQGPGLRIEIEKRIPVAAGMAGGSADAAAALRLAEAVAPVDRELLERVAVSLGADVPAQLRPGRWLGTGAGETLNEAPEVQPHVVLILPMDFGLSTPEVFREADRLGHGRTRDQLNGLAGAGAHLVQPGSLVNDLGPAAVSLRAEVDVALREVRAAGADEVLVSGSGPTVAGVFWGEEHAEDRARAAQARLGRGLVVRPVDESWARPVQMPGDRPE